jgi:Gp37 protein
MSDILTAERAIVAKLAAALPAIVVTAFPADPNEWLKPIQKDTIFVGWRGESLERPAVGTLNTVPRNINQSRTLTFELVFQFRDLRTHTRLYPVLEEVRDLLTGFRPIESPHARFLYESRAGFMDFNRALWLYSMSFELVLPYSRKQ